jgi:hypothetical protein
MPGDIELHATKHGKVSAKLNFFSRDFEKETMMLSRLMCKSAANACSFMLLKMAMDGRAGKRIADVSKNHSAAHTFLSNRYELQLYVCPIGMC